MNSYDYIFLVIIGSFFSGLGAVLQRSGLRVKPPIEIKMFFKIHEVLIHLFSSPRWFIGACCTVFGWSLYFQALRYGDLLVVKTLFSLNVVFAVILAFFGLKEKIVHLELIGISLTIVGSLCLAILPVTTRKESLDLNLLLIFTITAILFSLFSTFISTKRKIGKEIALGISSGTLYGLVTVYTNAIARLTQELHIFDIYSWIQVIGNPFFIILTIFSLTAFFIGTSALSLGRAAIVTPVINALAVIIPLLAAILLFGELLFPFGFSFYSIFRPLGITFVIVGTLILEHQKGMEK